MTAVPICPQCGQPLPSDGPRGLCPTCLLKEALPGQSAFEAGATALHDSSPATAIAPEAGERLKYFGDYELLEEIAKGGMGVYRLAVKAESAGFNRGTKESQATPKALSDPLNILTVREGQAILHEELNYLPERLRSPLVLSSMPARALWAARTRDLAAATTIAACLP